MVVRVHATSINPSDVISRQVRIPRFPRGTGMDFAGEVVETGTGVNDLWPGDVLLWQGQSAVWSRRDHHAYGAFLAVGGGSWAVAIIIFALVRDMTLFAFLVALFLLSAAALLDTVELAPEHWQQSTKRRQVEDDIHDVWNKYQARPGDIPAEECRRIQDAAYLLRRDGPSVPKWFYDRRRPETAAVTNDGTTVLRSSSDPG
ncbi:S-4TM family putative pore-forming effector [Streptomyces sp. B21-101]